MGEKRYEAKDGAIEFRIGSHSILPHLEEMQTLSDAVLKRLPNGAEGRVQLERFKERLDQAVTAMDGACDLLEEEGNPMYRPYIFK
jgi:hypothetical protein